MSFTQIIELDGVADEHVLHEHLAGWHDEQAGQAPGYLGARALADRDAPGRYLIEVDFSSEEEAKRNSDRPETSAWAERLQSLTGTAPTYRNLRGVYATG
jgi:antibiotic biosynthesis monooxygenase (ABM) superfamily enzyme